MRRTQTRSGAKARRPRRGQSHLFSRAEGAKEVSEPAEPNKPEEVNVARRKDGAGQTGGTADVCTRTVGREKTAAEPTGRPNTAPGNVMRAGRLKSSRGAPYFIPPQKAAFCVRRRGGDPRRRGKLRRKNDKGDQNRKFNENRRDVGADPTGDLAAPRRGFGRFRRLQDDCKIVEYGS